MIVLAGLGGPLLALSERRFIPIVVGEIIAGILVGPEALSIVDPANTTISFLGQVGFAMLMLTVGMHLPLRDPRLARSLRSGTLLAAIVAVLAIPAGLLAAAVAGTAHASVYAVVLASGSAAVLLPALEEADATGLNALAVMAQVTIADIVTILSVPIVLQPGRTLHALLGGVLVASGVVLLLATARLLKGRSWVGHVRRLSKQRHWALDLRLSLLVLFFARMGCAKERHQRPDRGLRRRADGRADRRTQTTLHTGARRGRRLLHTPLLRSARHPARPPRTL